jgi:hypothetical protein
VIEAGPFATGTVSFFADAATRPFATCAISGASRVQTCTAIYRTSVVGSHTIVATYGGDATHPMSAGATVFTVTIALADLIAANGSGRPERQNATYGGAFALLPKPTTPWRRSRRRIRRTRTEGG